MAFYDLVLRVINQASSFNQENVLRGFVAKPEFANLSPAQIIQLVNVFSSPYQCSALRVFTGARCNAVLFCRFSASDISSLINVFSSPYQCQALEIVAKIQSFSNWTLEQICNLLNTFGSPYQCGALQILIRNMSCQSWSSTHVSTLLNVFGSPYQVQALQCMAPYLPQTAWSYDILSVFASAYVPQASAIIKQYAPDLPEPSKPKTTNFLSNSIVVNGINDNGNGNTISIQNGLVAFLGNNSTSTVIPNSIVVRDGMSSINFLNGGSGIVINSNNHNINRPLDDDSHVEQEQMYRAMLASVQEQAQYKIKELEKKLAQQQQPVVDSSQKSENSKSVVDDKADSAIQPKQPKHDNNANEENSDINNNDKTVCIICLDKPRNMAFANCGHAVCCETCTTNLKTCPICRQAITSAIKIFLS